MYLKNYYAHNESFNLGVNRKHKLDSYRSTFAAATFKYFFIIFLYILYYNYFIKSCF